VAAANFQHCFFGSHSTQQLFTTDFPMAAFPRNHPIRFLLLFFCLLFNLPVSSVAQSKKTLLVVGVTNEIKDERWQDRRIGFGLTSLIAESFFDSGAFALLEEKEEIREQLKEVREKLWMLSEEAAQLQQAAATAGLAGAEMMAYGRVVSFKTPSTRVSMGPFHSREKITEIKVEVFLRDLKNDKSFSAEGRGKAKTTSTSIVFEYRQDRDEVNFDKTTVGEATKQAVVEAVKKVVKEYGKANR
jgi:curli biogenesis system outer membrane secretion channel CsgG